MTEEQPTQRPSTQWEVPPAPRPSVSFDDLDDDLQRDLAQTDIDVADLKKHVRALTAVVVVSIAGLVLVLF